MEERTPFPHSSRAISAHRSRQSSYPRRGLVRFARRALLCSWFIITAYGGNAIGNIYQLIHKDLTKLSDVKAVLDALLLPGPLAFWVPSFPLWIDVCLTLLFALFLAGCIWATKDSNHERELLNKESLFHALFQTLHPKEMIREPIRTSYPPAFDDILLPYPDHFVGRQGEFRWVIKHLTTRKSKRIVAIIGFAGMGKSALAGAVTRHLHKKGYFCDGIIVLFCQGKMNTMEVLQEIVTKFSLKQHQPTISTPYELVTFIQKQLKKKNALVVLDNIEPGLDIESVIKPLRDAEISILVTARHILPVSTFPPSLCLNLTALPEKEALDLFLYYLGLNHTELTDVEEEAAKQIVTGLHAHTLTIKITGAYGFKRDLVTLANELHNLQQVLKLPDGHTSEALKIVFTTSLKQLSPKTQRLFAALTTFSTLEFGRQAVVALAKVLEIAHPQIEINVLVQRAFVEAFTHKNMPPQSDRERLRLHPLLHAFAVSELSRWSEKKRQESYTALAYFYVSYAQANQQLLRSRGFDEGNISGVLEWAYSKKQDRLIRALCLSMFHFWSHFARHDASHCYLPWGIAAAKAIVAETQAHEDILYEADLAFSYAHTCYLTGYWDRAKRTFAENLLQRRQLQDAEGEAIVLFSLGLLTRLEGDTRNAERNLCESLRIHQNLLVQEKQKFQGEIGTQKALLLKDLGSEFQYPQATFSMSPYRIIQLEFTNLTSLSQLTYFRKWQEEFKVYHMEMLPLHCAQQNWSAAYINLYHIGAFHLLHGQFHEAMACFNTALRFSRARQSQRYEAEDIEMLGIIAYRQKHFNGAQGYCDRA